MKRTPWITGLIVGAIAIAVGACGGTSTTNNTTEANATHVLLDSPIAGITYTCKKPTGEQKTNERGEFTCDEAPVTFKIGGLVLGTIDDLASGEVWPQDLLGLPRDNFTDKKLIALLRLLQSLDDDGNISVSINITAETSAKFDTTDEDFDEEHLDQYAQTAGEGGNPIVLVSDNESIQNFQIYYDLYYQKMYNKIITDAKDAESSRSHNLDGKRFYLTHCIYTIVDPLDPSKDEIDDIYDPPAQGGLTGISWFGFEDGYVVESGTDPLKEGYKGWKIPYIDSDFYLLIGSTGSCFAFASIGDNYYLDLCKKMDDGVYGKDQITAFHKTREDALAYIRKVYTKQQRTCMVK